MKDHKKNKIFVIIPTYNQWQLLKKCLKSLQKQTYKNFNILVVDDGSNQDIKNNIKDTFSNINVLSFKKNKGFAKAVNKGVKYALNTYKPNYIALLNNDTRLDKNWLKNLIKRIRSKTQIAAVTSNMFFYNKPDIINSQGGTIDWNGDGYDINIFKNKKDIKTKSKPVLGACFAGCLIKSKALKQVGLLDQRFHAYYEDLDWSWRANLLGYKIYFEKDAILYHYGSESWEKGNRKKVYLTKRNCLASALKNYQLKNLFKRVLYILIGYFLMAIDHVFFTYNLDKQETILERIKYTLIPFQAILWNLIHLPKTLILRRKIQKKRKVNDKKIFNLIKDDKTPLNQFIESIKYKFSIQHIKDILFNIFSKNTNKFGVNILGYLDAQSGVGEAARTISKAIIKKGIPFALNNETTSPSKRSDNQFSKLFTTKNPYPINIITIYGDTFNNVINKRKNYLKNKYNIAYWAWELEDLPQQWVSLIDKVNEIWTPSTFVKNTFQKHTNKPIIVIPHPIEINPGPYKRKYFSINKNDFVFLFTFDFYSLFKRKNPFGVIKAFKKAFNKNSNTKLIIKCSNSSVDKENFKKLKKATKNWPIKIINKYLSRKELNSLLNIADTYVSLHRSEGFGLSIAESMALAKPVIATNYSGNTEFMNRKNSYPVDYKLIKIKKDHGPYKKGNVWADPNINQAAKLMKKVYNNPKKAKERGKIAKKYINNNLSPKSLSKKIVNRLNTINQKYIRK